MFYPEILGPVSINVLSNLDPFLKSGQIGFLFQKVSVGVTRNNPYVNEKVGFVPLSFKLGSAQVSEDSKKSKRKIRETFFQ